MMSRLPHPLHSSANTAGLQMPINQASNRTGASGMITAVMPIRLGDGLEAAHSPNRMLNDDAKMTEHAIEHLILNRARFPTRFAAWREALLTQFRQFDIGQITPHTDLIRQVIQQLTVLRSEER